MSDHPKDESKLPGGYAGGAASAARLEEDRKESARKAAETRRQDMVGPGAPASANQPQDHNAELRGATWKIEREGEGGAVQEQMRAGDEEAAAANRSRDKSDPDYDPNNPAEERIEAEFRGGA